MSDPQLRNFGVQPLQPAPGSGEPQPATQEFVPGAVPMDGQRARRGGPRLGAVRVRGRNAGPGIPYRAPKAKKPWYKRWWVWVIAVILVWVFFSNLGGGGSSGSSSTDIRGADSQAANALTAEAQQSAREAAEAEATAAAEAAAAEKAAADKAAAEKKAAEKAAAEAAAPAVTKPAGPTDAERSAILEARLREIFGGVDSMTELLGPLPGEWPGYVQGVRVEGDLANFTLQVDRSTAGGHQLGVDATQALSTLFGEADLKGISWIIVEDGAGVVIDQKQPNALY